MKRLTLHRLASALLCLTLALSLTACGGKKKPASAAGNGGFLWRKFTSLKSSVRALETASGRVLAPLIIILSSSFGCLLASSRPMIPPSLKP